MDTNTIINIDSIIAELRDEIRRLRSRILILEKSVKDLTNTNVYSVILSQQGAEDPTAVVQGYNSIGDIVWTNEGGTGNFKGTLAGAFPENKTSVFCATGAYSDNIVIVNASRISDDEIWVYTMDNTFTLTDTFTNISIRIEVANNT